MPSLATEAGGRLKTLNNKCKINIGDYEINLKILPEISDTKQASYADTTVIGRSTPIKTYSNSANRVISMKLHFLVVEESDIQKNIRDLYAIQSAVYPRSGDPYQPPPVCRIDCGRLLGNEPLCAVLENYSVSAPTDVVWDPDNLIPYYFEVTTTWHVVYASGGSRKLPNQERILQSGS